MVVHHSILELLAECSHYKSTYHPAQVVNVSLHYKWQNEEPRSSLSHDAVTSYGLLD